MSTWLEKLEQHMRDNNGHLAIIWVDGAFAVAYEFGQEAPDSQMAGGASYSDADSIGTAMAKVIQELRLGDGEEPA